jgi:glycosyltransferase involved in cell wall biosynthesis
MQKADVFCLPSYTECFPLSVLEAMACDVPVIATDVGDIKEMIQPPKGGHICSYSPKDIAEKILLATEKRDRFTARELSLRYTWQSTINKVEKIWETKMDA